MPGGAGAAAAITGVGYTPFTRQSGRTVLDLTTEAVLVAIADAGLAVEDVDGLICEHENDAATARDVAAALGMRLTWFADVLAGGGYPPALIGEAAMAVGTGVARNVVAYRVLNGRSGVRMGRFRLDQAGGVRQFMAPYGFGRPVEVFGMVAARYMHETGLSREHLARVAITQRAHAVANERAIRREPLSAEDYFGARMIAGPLGLFDCCQETDGGCAVVVGRADEHPNAPRIAAFVNSVGEGGRYPWDKRDDLTRSTLSCRADELFARAQVTREDLDVAEIYDAFTFEVLAALEEFGVCARGEVGDYVTGEGIGLDSPLPVNTHGGLLSEGYAQGMNHICEAVLQLRGACADRQVPDARVALVTANAFGSGSAMILVRD